MCIRDRSVQVRQIQMELWGWRIAEAIGFVVLLWVCSAHRAAGVVVVQQPEAVHQETAVPVSYPDVEEVQPDEKCSATPAVAVTASSNSSNSRRRRKMKKSVSVATFTSSAESGNDRFSRRASVPDIIWEEEKRRSFG
eukprot:TRINITY_DN2548_c0_g1_i2.p2 TRINITY_DN2548_c0_g1~~TRINITY_DN2548_c0_g1_i2.p2  ORF type:complete len:138 (+),score=32.13 TRINITY_DN2548_c0_g1_i2:84-497(+)